MTRIGIYLGFSPGAGGIFQYSLSVLEALRALPSNYEVTAAYDDPAWKPYLETMPFKTVELSHAKGLGWWWGRLGLPLWLWNTGAWRLDSTARFFAQSSVNYWIFPAQDHWIYLSRVSAIGTIHDLMHRYEPNFPEVSQFGRFWLREARYRRIVSAARAILVDSEVGKRQVVESYQADPEKIYPLPYVPPHYIFNEKTPDDFNQKFALPEKYFFYPAQFYAHKNHMRLLQAMASLADECPDMQLVLAGPKNREYEKVRQEAERLGLSGRVHFVGYVPDDYLPEMYRRARALVMPTFFGPTNIPPLEAMALGCPVIISGIYGMPEQMGGAAELIDPKQVNSISSAMTKIWDDEEFCKSLIKSGLQKSSQWNLHGFSNRLLGILALVAK